jgi:hypothetical protein
MGQQSSAACSASIPAASAAFLSECRLSFSAKTAPRLGQTEDRALPSLDEECRHRPVLSEREKIKQLTLQRRQNEHRAANAA